MRRFCLYCLCLLQSAAGWGQEGDLFEFFREEARVITVSRRPQPRERAPATVYVIDAEELRMSGTHTLWDALRRVPGVDVMGARSMYGVVGIRGLNKVLNNRTLVLVDGRRVLEGFTDNASWETLPVLLEEIDRIEVVEGPASALYGANAINGVINIITKIPPQVAGNRVSYARGERQTHLGSFLHAAGRPTWDYKLGAGWRSTHRFEDPDTSASRVGRFHALVRFDPDREERISLEAGGVWLETDLSLGGLGWGRQEGQKGFLRWDLVRDDVRLRVFWNGTREHLVKFTFLQGAPRLDYDTYNLNLERVLELSSDQTLVMGGEFWRNIIDSDIITAKHSLWALFFEYEWHIGRRWNAWTSGRLDQHPLTGKVISPRFSLVFTPVPAHMLRFSAGTAFRNPTLMENYLDIRQRLALAGQFQWFELVISGNPRLEAERMSFLEVAHSGQLGPVETTMAVFHYRLGNVISISDPTATIDPTRMLVRATLENEGETRAWGGEIGAEFRVNREVGGFVNYAYQRLSGELDRQVAAEGMPHHKINAGLRVRHRRLGLGLGIHWVDRTRWNTNQVYSRQILFEEVRGYTLVNLHLEYCFAGRLQNLELGFDAFNALNHGHFETLPVQSILAQGQGGEIIRARRMLTLDYHF